MKTDTHSYYLSKNHSQNENYKIVKDSRIWQECLINQGHSPKTKQGQENHWLSGHKKTQSHFFLPEHEFCKTIITQHRQNHSTTTTEERKKILNNAQTCINRQTSSSVFVFHSTAKRNSALLVNCGNLLPLPINRFFPKRDVIITRCHRQ